MMPRWLRPGRAARPAHASRLPFALLIIGLIVGGLALLLVLNTVSAANEVRRRGLAIKDESVAAEVQQLQNEVAASAAPARLAAAAAGLGMVPANHPAFIVLGSAGSARIMGKPGAVHAAPLAQPSHKKKPKPTKSASTSASPHPATSTGRTSATPGVPGATSSKTPTPTPTPTPTVTLPGDR